MLAGIIAALPDDARLFHTDFQFARNQYALVFWSGEWDRVPRGREIPELVVRIDTATQEVALEPLL